MRDDYRLARVQQLLLRIENVERRALADLLLLLHAGERDLGCINALVGRRNGADRRFDLRPCGDHCRAHLVTRDVDLDLAQPVLLLRLAHLRKRRRLRRAESRPSAETDAEFGSKLPL